MGRVHGMPGLSNYDRPWLASFTVFSSSSIGGAIGQPIAPPLAYTPAHELLEVGRGEGLGASRGVSPGELAAGDADIEIHGLEPQSDDECHLSREPKNSRACPWCGHRQVWLRPSGSNRRLVITALALGRTEARI